MATIERNLVNGTGLREDDNGLKMVRVHRISNLDSASSVFVQARAVSGIPEYGDEDEDFPELVCRNISLVPAMSADKKAVKIVAEYMPPDFSAAISPIIYFSAGVHEVLSCYSPVKDASGKYPLLRVYYETPHPSGTGGLLRVRTAQRVDAKKIGILEIERIEQDLPAIALQYLHSLNSSSWQGQPKSTWYMRNIAFEKQLYRPGYRVRYEIEYDEELHIETIPYRDPITDLIPDNIGPFDRTLPLENNATSHNGYINCPRAKYKDFNALTLPAVFA